MEFIAAFVILLLMIFAMAIGYIVQRKKIHGSCGGISALGMEKVCDCPEPCEDRKARMAEEEKRKQQDSQRIL